MKEWREFEYFHESWRQRVTRMAAYIEPGEIVADLGCGKQWLRNCLRDQNEYIPVDYVSRTPDTAVCDFNQYEFPNIYVDVIFASGVIEYVWDAKWFLRAMASHSDNKIVLSYCCLENVPKMSSRKKNNWVNHLTKDELLGVLAAAGFECIESSDMENNTIFLFRRRKKRRAFGVLVYVDEPGNLGDYTQALAAASIVGRVDDAVALHRESLHLYRGRRLPVICNGWFSHRPVQPASERLKPLYISLHITEKAKKWFSSQAMIDHLVAFSPVGCRDYDTHKFLTELGISAYYSGCLTYSLGLQLRERFLSNGSNIRKEDTVYMVDPPVLLERRPLAIVYGLIAALKDRSLLLKAWVASRELEILRRVRYLVSFLKTYGKLISSLGSSRVVIETQSLRKHEQRVYDPLFERIVLRLHCYASARAVVTGRIHVAIPAFVSGANTVFVQEAEQRPPDLARVFDHAQIFTKKIQIGEGAIDEEKFLEAINMNSEDSWNLDPKISELANSQKMEIERFIRAFYDSGTS